MNPTFRYEMHTHTAACSKCGSATGEELVDAAKECGYAGIVLTNHFYHGNTAIDRALSWEEFVGAYAEDYCRTKEYAKKYDLDVLFGIEEGYGPGKEVLIYGLSPETVAATPAFRDMSIAEISAFVHANHGILAYAHPFRHRDYIKDPDAEPDPLLVDMIEGYNAHNAPGENPKAMEFAQKNHLPIIAGGDVHHTDSIGLCGVDFTRRLTTSENLVADLLAGRYQLYINHKE